jgi:hypothetical protein
MATLLFAQGMLHMSNNESYPVRFGAEILYFLINLHVNPFKSTRIERCLILQKPHFLI